MTANVSTVVVPTKEQLEQAIMSYVAQGFVVSTQTADTVTLFKKKEFNVLWAVIGFFLCLLPLLIYCIVYATQKDAMVVVRVDPNSGEAAPFAALPVAASTLSVVTVEQLTWSEDRVWWWNGTTWIKATDTVPPGAQFSPDGAQWWDGLAWRARPGDSPAGEWYSDGETVTGEEAN